VEADGTIPLRFNLSHFGALILAALANDRCLGINVRRSARSRKLGSSAPTSLLRNARLCQAISLLIRSKPFGAAGCANGPVHKSSWSGTINTFKLF
jgi:hypothetical protein